LDDIEVDLREMWLDCVDWIYLAQDRDRLKALMNAVMNLSIKMTVFWVVVPRTQPSSDSPP
jgi:hypothetical protein